MVRVVWTDYRGCNDGTGIGRRMTSFIPSAELFQFIKDYNANIYPCHFMHDIVNVDNQVRIDRTGIYIRLW